MARAFAKVLKQKHPKWKVYGLDYLSSVAARADLAKDLYDETFFGVEYDIADELALMTVFTERTVDVVVNFAAETHVDRSIEDARPFVHSNVKGVTVLSQLCSQYKIKLLQISTDEVFGHLDETELKHSFKEDDVLSPRNPYSATKAAAEMMIKSFGMTNGLDYMIVRSCNTYGEGQYWEKFIPKSVSNLFMYRSIPLHRSNPYRQWLYVEDFADAVVRMLEKWRSKEVYHVGSPHFYRVKEVARFLLKITNKTEEHLVWVNDRAGLDFAYKLDYSKFEKDYGKMKVTDFGEGLKRTVEWTRRDILGEF